MSNKPVVLYLGSDKDYQEELERLVDKSLNDRVRVITQSIDKEPLAEIIINNLIVMVIIDFSENKISNKVFEQVLRIKNSDEYKSILFSGLFSSEEELKRFEYSAIDGFTFFQIKGSEEWLLILESLNIAFGVSRDNIKFATAKELGLTIDLYSCSYIRGINSEKLILESDVAFEDEVADEVNLRMNLFEYDGSKGYSIERLDEGVCLKPSFYRYTLLYPYSGAWDDDPDSGLHEDTVETWLELNAVDLKKQNSALIFTKNKEFFSEFISLPDNDLNVYNFDHKLNTTQLTTLIDDVAPAVIFYEISDELFDLQYGNEVIKQLVNIGNSTVFVMLNSVAGSPAAQKMFGYKNILCSKDIMTTKLFQSFSKATKQKTHHDEIPFYNFSNHDPRQLAFIKNNVELISISEHELNFKADLKIPLFSVLKIELPIDCFLTIVEDDDKGAKHLYRGILHGISSIHREELRRIVNQFIFNKPTELSFESIKAIKLEEGLVTQKTEHVDESPVVEEQKSRVEESSLDYSQFKRKKRGKFSKL